MKITGDFRRFQYFNFEISFLKNRNFFLKTGVISLSSKSKIEKATFPGKASLSEANVATNRMVSTKRTYHKERSFASSYLIFLKKNFSLRTSYKEFISCTNYRNIHTDTFCKQLSFEGVFSLWVSLTTARKATSQMF